MGHVVHESGARASVSGGDVRVVQVDGAAPGEGPGQQGAEDDDARHPGE